MLLSIAIDLFQCLRWDRGVRGFRGLTLLAHHSSVLLGITDSRIEGVHEAHVPETRRGVWGLVAVAVAGGLLPEVPHGDSLRHSSSSLQQIATSSRDIKKIKS